MTFKKETTMRKDALMLAIDFMLIGFLETIMVYFLLISSTINEKVTAIIFILVFFVVGVVLYKLTPER